MQYHWKLLKPLYKYTKTFILLTAHKKQQLLRLQIWKKNNIFCSTVGGWYKELKVKELCVFEFIELLFVNGVFQNNYFKTHILQKTKLKYTCLMCLIVASLTEPLSFCVFDYYRKVCKRKQLFTTVAINKNTEILLSIHFHKMKQWI